MASDTTTFPLSGPIDLLVRLGRGSITVAAEDGLAEAVVRIVPRKGDSGALERFTVEMQGPTLVVSGPRQGGLADLITAWRGDRDSVDAVIRVPAGTPLKIATASDEVKVTGRCGDADVATGSARITFDTVAGDLRLRYARATARVATVTGSAKLSAGGGSAHFGEVHGALDCSFASGELIADVVRGGLRSRAGHASAYVGAIFADADLAFGSGPISLGVPTGVSAHVDLVSGTGQVQSDLPVEDAPTAGARPVTLRAHTGSGEVRVLRSAAG